MTIQMSAEQYATEKARLDAASHGAIEFSDPNNFKGSLDGVIVNGSYAEPILTITIVKKPFFLSESLIEHKIQTYLAGE